MWFNGSFVPWMCISINCNMLSYQYGPTFLKNTFSTLLDQCHIELRQVKHSSISMVFLIIR